MLETLQSLSRSSPPVEAGVDDATAEKNAMLEIIYLAHTSGKTSRNTTLLRQLITGQNLAETYPISANKRIVAILLGKAKKIVETRAGFLAIEVRDEMQRAFQTAEYSLRRLNGIDVEVKANDRMYRIKGTIKYENRPNYSTERIHEELKQSKVVDNFQFNKKRNGMLENLPTYIVTFASCHLPEEVSVGSTKCPVRLYNPRPRRCFKCQAFGQGANSCLAQVSSCQNCGIVEH